MIHAQLVEFFTNHMLNGADAPDLDTSNSHYDFEAKTGVVCAASALCNLLYLHHILVFTQSLG